MDRLLRTLSSDILRAKIKQRTDALVLQAIEADAPEGRHVEIRAAFEKHVVKSRVLSNGVWSILPERSQASASDLEFLFEVTSDETSPPVKISE